MTTPDFEATADAFGLLADPVRVEILDALWHSEETPVPYSDVRDAVGLRDSGRFNYHLSKLTDHFVEKTEDGYRLRPTGLLVVNAIYAGSYVDAPSREGIDVDGTCPTCGTPLVGEYDAGMFRVSCLDCDDQLFTLSFSPRGVARRDDEAKPRFGVVAAVGQIARHVEGHAVAVGRRDTILDRRPVGELVERDRRAGSGRFERLDAGDRGGGRIDPPAVDVEYRRHLVAALAGHGHRQRHLAFPLVSDGAEFAARRVGDEAAFGVRRADDHRHVLGGTAVVPDVGRDVECGRLAGHVAGRKRRLGHVEAGGRFVGTRVGDEPGHERCSGDRPQEDDDGDAREEGFDSHDKKSHTRL
jgi:DNA-binding transcriptional ArsR family regulator